MIEQGKQRIVVKTMSGETVFDADGCVTYRSISTNEYHRRVFELNMEFSNRYSGSLLGEEDYKIPFPPPDHEFSDAECEAARKELNGLLEDTT